MAEIDIKQEEFLTNNLIIDNLPNKTVENREDLISFCFLLFGIPEENCRKEINCSRITEKFWKQIKTLNNFELTFNKFTERELNNTFKYIVYLPACQKFEINLVLKTYFHLKESKLIDSNLSIADIGKSMMYWLTKIKELARNDSLKTKETIELCNFTKEILDFKIIDLYVNVKEKKVNQKKNLLIKEPKATSNDLTAKQSNISSSINNSNNSLNLKENQTTCETSENKLNSSFNDNASILKIENSIDNLAFQKNQLNARKNKNLISK